MKTFVLLAMFVCASATLAQADYIYSYDHALSIDVLPLPFGFYIAGAYQPTDRLTGSLVFMDTFAVPDNGRLTAGVLSYSFTDGHQTLTEANSVMLLACCQDPTARREWVPGQPIPYFPTLVIRAADGSGALASIWGDASPSAWLNDGVSLVSYHSNNSGEGWTVTQVPEPGTLLLVGLGLVGLAGWKRACPLRVRS